MGRRKTPEVRTKLHQLVVAEPGLHLRELARDLDVVVSHAKYHLDQLIKQGAISGLREGRHLRYYPQDAVGASGKTDSLGAAEKRVLGVLRKAAVRTVVEYLLEHPGSRHGEIAKGVGRSPSTITHHLHKLLDLGMIEETDRRFSLRGEDMVRKLLSRYPTTRPGLINSLLDNMAEVWDDLYQ